MANQFGIEFDSITEIQAAEDQQFAQAQQKAVQSQNEQALVMATRAKAISQIFPSAEKRKAAATARVMENVSKLQKTDDENEFDFQVRQAEAIREQAASVNPEVALKANEQILTLRNAQLQQNKLRVGTETAAQNLTEAKDVALLTKQGWVFERQPDGEVRPVAKLTDEQPGPEDLALFEEMRKGNPNLILGSGLDVLKIENLLGGSRSKEGKGINNSTQQKHLEALQATGGFARDVKNLTSSLQEDVGALGLGRDALGTLSGLNQSVDRFRSALLEDAEDPDKAFAAAEATFDDVAAVDERLANATSLAKSQVKAMAYKLAKALDPGGRLSDQDVEMAIEMIIGSGNAEVIQQLLVERLDSTYQGVQASIDLANGGMVFGDVGRREAVRLDKIMDEATSGIQDFSAGVQAAKQEGKLGNTPGATKPGEDKPQATHRFNPATGKVEAI